MAVVDSGRRTKKGQTIWKAAPSKRSKKKRRSGGGKSSRSRKATPTKVTGTGEGGRTTAGDIVLASRINPSDPSSGSWEIGRASGRERV